MDQPSRGISRSIKNYMAMDKSHDSFLKLIHKHDEVIRNRNIPLKLRWLVCNRFIRAIIKDCLKMKP